MTKKKYRREELLEIAIDLFAQNGYVGTSIRDIAKAIDRSVSNVYHYFENKEELWLAILEYSVQGLPEKLRSVAHGEGEPLDRFKELLRVHLNRSIMHRRETKIFFIDEERLSPKGKLINKQIQKEILDIYVEQLRILQSHKLLRTKNLKILAFNILATINWFLRWYDPEGDMSKEEVFDEIIGFVLHGMCSE
ncbi:TetR family transcriptional regulator [Kordiimonas sediminis]|uniref:TetR family transcriptional regulator n=1 Tax=Kordiimonas sediminis TaxID=1735581 RepID=A0A919ALV9_9PROT|nr:TetR/AcrR family transcriptional regulator [Kordiimonas sediminis]GHF14062.1 TetR family transcriptional regulator [Kordiimonas sediminis]